MKLTRRTKGLYHFQLAPREKHLLLQVLQLYPQIPTGYQHLSKTAQADEANQRLLNEALQETRTQNKKQLESLLADPSKLSKSDQNWRLTLSGPEIDWLLQVLNDVRVGSWVQLGSPEAPVEGLTSEMAPHYWALEMAGYFQGRFLELLEA